MDEEQNHIITLEYIKERHTNALHIEDKIIYLSAMYDYLRVKNIVNKHSDFQDYKQDIKELLDIRNNLVHIVKNNLKVSVWQKREKTHNRIYNFIKDMI